MISRIEGRLVAVGEGRVHVQCDHLTYELLVPAADEQRLATLVDETVSFHTLHYLEGQGQGSTFLPRMIGFVSAADRAFFELFTTVKGMGNRKALRALTLPFPAVAEAIAAKDLDILRSLPEVGRRTAETIVAELHGKVDGYVELKPTAASVPPEVAEKATLIHDAIQVLTQLGESRRQAQDLVERAITADPTIDTAEGLVAAAFRIKEKA